MWNCLCMVISRKGTRQTSKPNKPNGNNGGLKTPLQTVGSDPKCLPKLKEKKSKSQVQFEQVVVLCGVFFQ